MCMHMIEKVFNYSKFSLPMKGVLTNQKPQGKSMVSEKGPNELVVSEKGFEKTRSVEWVIFYMQIHSVKRVIKIGSQWKGSCFTRRVGQ